MYQSENKFKSAVIKTTYCYIIEISWQSVAFFSIFFSKQVRVISQETFPKVQKYYMDNFFDLPIKLVMSSQNKHAGWHENKVINISWTYFSFYAKYIVILIHASEKYQESFHSHT